MISGLRQLPRVQAERKRQLDDGAPAEIAEGYMDCTSCKASREHSVIAPERKCGWMHSSQWVDGMKHHDEDICPGYSIQLPEVIETARLYAWREKGQLQALVEDLPLTSTAALYVDTLASSVSEVEADGIRRMRQEASNGS